MILASFMYGYFRNTIHLPFIESLIIIFILSSMLALSQTKTNLEVFYSLTDSLTDEIASHLPDKDNKMFLTLNLGESYAIFSNNIKSGLKKHGKEIFDVSPGSQSLPEVNVNLTDAKVNYSDIERSGWFGDYYVTRTIFIKGDYLISPSNDGLNNFYFASVDSVKVDEIETLESNSFPFTKGEIPSEPFFSSLWEPVIAVGVAAVTVILFFSVRSK